MKLCGATLLLIALAALPSLVYAATEGKSNPITVQMDDLEVRSIGADRITFDLRSSVTATRKLKINRVRFLHVRLQTMPIYLAPIEQRLELDPAKTTVLPAIPLTIYFRDLHSLEPLEQAIEDGKATVKGNVRADLELNLVERIASRQWNASGEMPVEMTIPVEVPGGVAGRGAALATLRAAQIAMDVGGSALGSLQLPESDWEQDLRTKVVPSLVVAETRYSLKLSNGQRVDLAVRGMGFRTSEDQFVLTGEMVEPWKYDVDVSAALQTGQATLLDEGRDLLVWPAGEPLDPASARSVSHGSVRLEHVLEKKITVDVLIEGKTVKVHVMDRESDSNYALLRFTQPRDKGTAISLAPAQEREAMEWDRTAIFRPGERGAMELVFTRARRKNNRIVLDDPIDDLSFGSPLMVPEGSLGMVQGETSARLLPKQW